MQFVSNVTPRVISAVSAVTNAQSTEKKIKNKIIIIKKKNYYKNFFFLKKKKENDQFDFKKMKNNISRIFKY